MNAHTAQVQASVQHLVMENGQYAPLELLLTANRLGYEDYRAWREGRLETLDAVLVDGTREIHAWLEAAQSWANALGLAAERALHHGWENNAGTVLVASADPRLNALLSTRFRHTREHDQLDLFIDSAQTAAVNALVDALTARNASETRRALERLVRINHDHGQRFHAAKLISAHRLPRDPSGESNGSNGWNASGSLPRLPCSAPVGAISWRRCGATLAGRSTRPRSIQAIPNAMHPGRTEKGSTGSA